MQVSKIPPFLFSLSRLESEYVIVSNVQVWAITHLSRNTNFRRPQQLLSILVVINDKNQMYRGMSECRIQICLLIIK